MKLKLLFFMAICILSAEGQAQDDNKVALQLSYNQVELLYGKNIEKLSVEIEGYLGLANQDINTGFNDFLGGVRIVFPVIKFEKSELQVLPEIGFYIPNNPSYEAPACTLGGEVGYRKYLGARQKIYTQIRAGYRYGRREYKQEYENDIVYVATKGTFKVSPLTVSIGCGFCF